MPIFFSIGMAISDLHVVGLQEPPRNTSHGGGDASLPATFHFIIVYFILELTTNLSLIPPPYKL